MLRVSVLAVAALAASLAGAQDFGSSQGKPMPQFIITTIGGKKITNKQLKGKVVLFDFWATWCGPCKMASPAMQKLAKTYGSKGLVVIGADTFENSPGPAGARAYAKEHKYTYTFTYENDGLAHSLGITGIPAFALVDKKGVIRDALTGVPHGGAEELYAALSRRVASLLKS
ncbi:MAG TPA: TlpA disulfide reductase family protein [Fimbriimonas sp.]|nr:TlpA disulfide reductase family protein [Fimbriimonas sp.]